MNTTTVLALLIVATTLEASGDAIVRLGLGQEAVAPRLLFFAIGGALLFGYGLFLNLAPIAFERVVGLYIATLFVVWQIINFAAFRTVPSPPVLAGGALIVMGGAIVTFWRA
jgi:hypothetical protein